jgi:hypothetical protein
MERVAVLFRRTRNSENCSNRKLYQTVPAYPWFAEFT